MEVTFGGDRIGSGAGIKVAMHNYEMSTQNLSQRFTSTMGCGTLIPCLCIPATRGDYFDIDINAQARTIPTRGPLFSTFKMQVDLYDAPMRLYQALLHNNAIRLGMNMSQVKLPKLEVMTYVEQGGNVWKSGEFAANSLLKYLGQSGLGRIASNASASDYGRRINAIPPLAYYDIFKNYYANKQEENAYLVATNEVLKDKLSITEATVNGTPTIITNIESTTNDLRKFKGYKNILFGYDNTSGNSIHLEGELSDNIVGKDLYLLVMFESALLGNVSFYYTLDEAYSNNFISDYDIDADNGSIDFDINEDLYPNDDVAMMIAWENNEGKIESEQSLTSFPLSNIDDMRLDLLSYHTLGSPFIIGKTKQTGDKDVYLPYSTLTEVDSNNVTKNKQALNGVCIKTYQSDLFNNWLNTEWVEGENGIAEMSKVAVTDGAIYMDALLFAKKTYNLLNRVAVSDGTYQSWLDAVYTESPKRHIETPMFVGGLSTEIVFEEIVQTTPADGKALGTLGGRGILIKRKGGNAYIECDEPSFIIGIVSITPRVFYSQGNEFYMTDLDSIDDLHKPEYDGIGFQNLVGERMCWTDTIIAPATATVLNRTVVGKVPAWIEYMTAVDKTYGEFTDVEKQGYMVLNRNYSVNENTGVVKDFTTYVDPSKYNYAFGESTLFSQNFWVQIQFDIKARRKMSAREIPNL